MIERIRMDKARITDVVNEITGRKAGVRIEHYDGRVGGVATPETAELPFDCLGIGMSLYQKNHYERLRSQGASHAEALFRTPNN